MNSETASQLFNIAVAHMKFAKFSTIYQLKGRQTHTHTTSSQCSGNTREEDWRVVKTAAATETHVDEASEVVQPEWALMLYKGTGTTEKRETKDQNNLAKFSGNDWTAPSAVFDSALSRH